MIPQRRPSSPPTFGLERLGTYARPFQLVSKMPFLNPELRRGGEVMDREILRLSRSTGPPARCLIS